MEIMNELLEEQIYGYDIRHLFIIATILWLREEGLPPERVAEVINNIDRIAELVWKETTKAFNDALKQVFNQAKEI